MRINTVQNNTSNSYYKPIPLKNNSMNSAYVKQTDFSSKLAFGMDKALLTEVERDFISAVIKKINRAKQRLETPLERKIKILRRFGIFNNIQKETPGFIATVNGKHTVNAQFSTEIPFEKWPSNAKLLLNRMGKTIDRITETVDNIHQMAGELLRTTGTIRETSDETVGILDSVLERLSQIERITLKRKLSRKGQKGKH